MQRSEARLSPSFFPRTAKRIEPGASAQQEPSGSMSAKGLGRVETPGVTTRVEHLAQSPIMRARIMLAQASWRLR